jgi:hypothetical protein
MMSIEAGNLFHDSCCSSRSMDCSYSSRSRDCCLFALHRLLVDRGESATARHARAPARRGAVDAVASRSGKGAFHPLPAASLASCRQRAQTDGSRPWGWSSSDIRRAVKRGFTGLAGAACESVLILVAVKSGIATERPSLEASSFAFPGRSAEHDPTHFVRLAGGREHRDHEALGPRDADQPPDLVFLTTKRALFTVLGQ